MQHHFSIGRYIRWRLDCLKLRALIVLAQLLRLIWILWELCLDVSDQLCHRLVPCKMHFSYATWFQTRIVWFQTIVCCQSSNIWHHPPLQKIETTTADDNIIFGSISSNSRILFIYSFICWIVDPTIKMLPMIYWCMHACCMHIANL